MSSTVIGRVLATEKHPTTIDDFTFWTDPELILNPFDIVKVQHVNNSFSYGVIEDIAHITDAASFLTNFISSDFGDVMAEENTLRVGMNYVTAKVVCNTENIYIPLQSNAKVMLATADEINYALGLNDIRNPLVCGYLEMYAGTKGCEKVTLPVNLNSKFIIGPEGAHLNISGISGLASKTSYAMFLLKAIQDINFAKQLCKKPEDVMVGGIMSSLVSDEVYAETGIKPFIGLLNTPGDIDPDNDLIIDELPLDYSILEEIDYIYPANNAYFAYMTRGCVNKCKFCAVPKLEPQYCDYINLKKRIEFTDKRFGARKDLLLLDNNVLASKCYDEIIDEIKECGFGSGAMEKVAF